eukprot:gene58383-77899_t
MNWRVKLPVTLNEKTRGVNLVKEVIKYYTTGRGALSLTAGVVYGFVRTRPGLESPDMQFHMAHASYDTAQKRDLEREPGMTVVIGQCRPDSRGSIHIKSAIPGSEPAIRLAAKLAELLPGDLNHIYFSLGGADRSGLASALYMGAIAHR